MSNSYKENEQQLLIQGTEKEAVEQYRDASQNHSKQVQNTLNVQQGIAIQNTSDVIQMNQNVSSSENLIHQQYFGDQKKIIIKILIIFFIWSLIEFFLLYGLLLGMNEFVDQIAPYIFPISLIFMYGLGKFGTMKQNRQFPLNLIVLIVQVYLSTQTYLMFCRLFSNSPTNDEDGIKFSTADIIFIYSEYQLIYNCGISLILIIYFAIEQETIRIFVPIAACCIAALIPLIFNIFLFINSIISVIYGTIIMIVIGQIFKGRFSMEMNNVIAGTNILFFGLIMPVDLI